MVCTDDVPHYDKNKKSRNFSITAISVQKLANICAYSHKSLASLTPNVADLESQRELLQWI